MLNYMDEERIWYPYDEGKTTGKRGPAGGRIVRDEEWGDADEPEDADARITLETLPDSSFSVTVNLYGGWLQETASFVREVEAKASFAIAQEELVRLATLIPEEDDKNMSVAIEAMNGAVAEFTIRFGGKPTL